MLDFGPFRIDLRTCVLTRDGATVPLSPRLVQVLACLADARGALVTRELLLERCWPDVIVADNTLTRAIADIRIALGDSPGAPAYIQTLARRGYRFVAPVADAAAPPEAGHEGVVPVSDAVAGLEPFLAWERGRAALESLSIAALPAAAEAFSRAVAGAPHYAAGYAGLANAHVFRFEATRVDDVPDVEALASAVAAATRATELDPTLGEGWAALGHALAGAGRTERARAAVRQALALEPRNWRHHYRLAACSWGEDRLRAVERAEALLPGFPSTQTLAAMVLIARQSFEFARQAAERGAAAQVAPHDRRLQQAHGLLWMRGLTAVARGAQADALDDFRAEAGLAAAGTSIYARECSVIAHEALGFLHLMLGETTPARAAFHVAATASPGHGRAMLGRAIAGGRAADAVESIGPAAEALGRAGKLGERTLLLAAAHGWAGRGSDGVALVADALAGASSGPMGWSLPADPMFAPLRAADGYHRVASMLASRAS
ncbi:winged helix-turn-helix domain-containing protein [Luteitalea sp.]